MIQNYSAVKTRIQNRLNPQGLLLESQRTFSEELRSLSYSDVLQFVRVAMKGVPPEYTAVSREAGENVKTHLRRDLEDVSYEFQGSVMTNTHVTGYSDIDLLVMCEKFYVYDRATVNRYLTESAIRTKLFSDQVAKLEAEANTGNYMGDVLQDLLNNRLTCESSLQRQYTEYDISKPKSIKITNKGLNRDVDIVIANWYDDVNSILYGRGERRGIQIYNKAEHKKENADYPFLSISRINARGQETNGRLKKMIRFMKNIKKESTLAIELSSFDMNAICYDIPVDKYVNKSFTELVYVIYSQLHSIANDTEHANRLKSVDGHEHIFLSKPEKLSSVRHMLQEVQQVFLDLAKATQLV